MAAQVTVNNRYRLDERPLARGGMGEIWTARDLRLDRTVIVKLIRFPDGEPDTEFLRRFQREALLTARLDHPGVPAVYDIGVHLGRPYLVMQFIRGINVADVNAEQAPLPIAWAATIGAQVSSVLIAAHHAGLIHRDIKPGNLMIDRNGAVKVLDFGLAAALGGSDASRITRTGQSIGTPAYMAPEQVTGAATTPSTDLYGLGCTLFDLLAGRPPFTAPNSYALMSQHVTARPPRLREFRTDIPERLEEVVLALMEKLPEDRLPRASASTTRSPPSSVTCRACPECSAPRPMRSTPMPPSSAAFPPASAPATNRNSHQVRRSIVWTLTGHARTHES